MSTDDLLPSHCPLVVEFSVGKSVFDKIDEEGSTVSDDVIADAISCLQRAAKIVIEEQLFSSNETVDDINTQHLKYLLIPYYLAGLHQQSRDLASRQASLERALVLYNQFLTECHNKQIMHATEAEAFEKDIEGVKRNATDQRAEKIARFNKEKALKIKLETILNRRAKHHTTNTNNTNTNNNDDDDENDDEEEERDFVVALLRLCVVRALDARPLLAEEIRILAHMRTRAPQTGQQADTRIKAQTQPTTNTTRVTPGANAWDLRSKIQAKVFTSGLSKPTMSLEEFAELEMKAALERQQKQKEYEAQKAALDLDSSEYADQQTLKDRRWDDYKDDNPKGAGNTGLKSTFDVMAFKQENPQFKL